MREIKFRAWDCDNEVMSYSGLSFNNIDNLRESLDSFCSYFSYDYFEENPNYLMQFTGLKDKNGTDIYCGDVFRIDGKIYYVEFINDLGRYVLTTGKGYDTKNCLDFDCDVIYEREVVGNIHKNKNLLK